MKTKECPKHGGSFDCTPFCPVCAGDQEYSDPNMTVHYDPPAMSWEEVANLTHETQVSTFGWCACEDAVAPYADCPRNRFTFGLSHFGGNPYAKCVCGYTSVYWEEEGDLTHDCTGDPYGCDRCGDFTADGHGFFSDGRRLCGECASID